MPATAARTLAASARSPRTISVPGASAPAAVRSMRRGLWPAARRRGTSAVPMKPLAPVTSTLATPPPGACLGVNLLELFGGEPGPAVARIRRDHEAEPIPRFAQPPELPQTEPDVVVALRHPHAARKAVDDRLVAEERLGRLAGAQQARRAEERRVRSGVRLPAEEDGPLEVALGRRVVLSLERMPALLVEAGRSHVAEDVPRGRREQGDRDGCHEVRLKRHEPRWRHLRRDTAPARSQAQHEADEAERDPDPVGRDPAVAEMNVRAVREHEHEGGTHE